MPCARVRPAASRRRPACARNARCRAPPPSSSRRPGWISCAVPRLSRCMNAPSNRYVTVASPMCGCGRTSTPCPGPKSAGPMWSKKMNGPMVCSPAAGSSRRTAKPPRSRGRPSMTRSIDWHAPSPRRFSRGRARPCPALNVTSTGMLRLARRSRSPCELRPDHAEFPAQFLDARVVAVALQLQDQSPTARPPRGASSARRRGRCPSAVARERAALGEEVEAQHVRLAVRSRRRRSAPSGRCRSGTSRSCPRACRRSRPSRAAW